MLADSLLRALLTTVCTFVLHLLLRNIEMSPWTLLTFNHSRFASVTVCFVICKIAFRYGIPRKVEDSNRKHKKRDEVLQSLLELTTEVYALTLLTILWS